MASGGGRLDKREVVVTPRSIRSFFCVLLSVAGFVQGRKVVSCQILGTLLEGTSNRVLKLS